MDLTRRINYRGFELNHVDLTNGLMEGCEVKRLAYPGIPGFGYKEKRALADGFDASDVYLGLRTIQMSGSLYGIGRAAFYDLLQSFITACTPTAAYAESPGDRGYLPLDFYVPTTDVVNWGAEAVIHKMVRARPTKQPGYTIADDSHGGVDADALSARWEAEFDCIDPRIYGYAPIDTTISPTASSGSGNLVNRGDYPTPLNIILQLAAAAGSGTFHFVGGGADFSISITSQANSGIIRVSGDDRIVTLETNTVETLRMDLIHHTARANYPLVQPGSNPYSWDLTGTTDLVSGSLLRFWEAWA